MKEVIHKFQVTVATTSVEDSIAKIRDVLCNGLYQGETDEVLVGITEYSVYHISTQEV